MKKKLIVTLALALCVLICAFSFVGCSKPSGAEEFNEFKQKVVNVLKDNGVNVVENQADESVGTVVSPTAKYVSTNSVDQIKEIILGDSDVISDVGIVEQVRKEMYEQALLIPLVVGDGMVNNHNADTIYNTSVFIDSWWKAYMEFKTSGTVTTINSYIPAYGGDSVYSGVVYLDYTSKDNYNFVMFLIWENGKMGYRYGNSQKQFIYFDYDPQDDDSEIFCSSKVGEGYISIDADVVKECFELVKHQFDGMKVEDYNYLTEAKYTFDTQEWMALCAKYFPSEE